MKNITGIINSRLTPELKLILALTLARVVLHILFINNYGIFRDEMYYLACGENLDFGYVDHPPFVAVVAKISTLIFGDSLFGVRILSVLASSSLVFLAGLFALEFGGDKRAVLVACLLVFFGPVLIGTGIFLSMNSFDQMFWMLVIYVFIRLLKTSNQKLWIWLGIIIGIGFQTKISILFLCLGLFIGLLLTPHRRTLMNKYLWTGVLCAFVIALPNIIWQIVYEYPTLEFIHNASTLKNKPLSPAEFILGQIMNINPFFFLFVLAGLWFFFFHKEGKLFIVLGWVFVALLVFFIATKSKIYYMAPVYPFVLAAGAVMVTKWFKSTVLISILIVLNGLISLPFAVPVLPIDQFITYSKLLGIKPEQHERNALAELPQMYADMYGWESLTKDVAGVYNSLTTEQKQNCGIYAQNYGQAGAIDYFGKRMGLPAAYSGHNSYWIWGSRRIRDYDIMIIIGGDPEDHKKVYKDVKIAAFNNDKYVMPFERNRYIYLCSGLKTPIRNVWPSTKFYI